MSERLDKVTALEWMAEVEKMPARDRETVLRGLLARVHGTAHDEAESRRLEAAAMALCSAPPPCMPTPTNFTELRDDVPLLTKLEIGILDAWLTLEDNRPEVRAPWGSCDALIADPARLWRAVLSRLRELTAPLRPQTLMDLDTAATVTDRGFASPEFRIHPGRVTENPAAYLCGVVKLYVAVARRIAHARRLEWLPLAVTGAENDWNQRTDDEGYVRISFLVRVRGYKWRMPGRE